jgi:hypothetical protein
MSEYKGIKGFQVQTRTEDPTPYAQALADNPYAGSWSSGGALNLARSRMGSSKQGSVTASLVFGGSAPGSSPGWRGETESYNGTAWTEVADLNQLRGGLMGAGTQTAALGAGGYYPVSYATQTETWNGSAWTEVNEMNIGRYNLGGNGTQTAALATGGEGDPGGAIKDLNESWNGSTWTEVGDMNRALAEQGQFGTSTAAIIAGGTPGTVALVSSWNGSSWTETGDLNQGRYAMGSAGTQTSGLVFGGRTPPATYANTESWDGSAWTEVADLATSRSTGAGDGAASTNALFSGGVVLPNSLQTATEEWTFSGLDPSTTPAANYANAITGDFYYNSTTGS